MEIENQLEYTQYFEKYLDVGFWLTPVCSYNHSHMSAKHCQKCDCPGKAALLRGWKDTYCPDIETLRGWMLRFEEMKRTCFSHFVMEDRYIRIR